MKKRKWGQNVELINPSPTMIYVNLDIAKMVSLCKALHKLTIPYEKLKRQVHNRQVDTILKWNQATIYFLLI